MICYWMAIIVICILPANTLKIFVVEMCMTLTFIIGQGQIVDMPTEAMTFHLMTLTLTFRIRKVHI